MEYKQRAYEILSILISYINKKHLKMLILEKYKVLKKAS